MRPRSAHQSPGSLRRLAVPAALLLASTGVGAAPAAATPDEHSDTPVFTIPPPFPPGEVGTSYVVRTGDGISLRVRTSGLEPGHAVTLWVAVANDPDACQAGIPGVSRCGPDDHEAGRGQISVHHAGGHVVGRSGTATFGAHLSEGDTSRALFEEDPGLRDSGNAEVVLVVKTHGPATPGLVSDQLHTFAGGCADQSTPETLTPRPGMLGAPGDNHCAEIQVSAHTASD